MNAEEYKKTIEQYKKSNPAKYELKKASFEAKLISLGGEVEKVVKPKKAKKPAVKKATKKKA